MVSVLGLKDIRIALSYIGDSMHSVIRHAARSARPVALHEKGAIAVEFALLAPLLITVFLVVGLIGVEVRNFMVIDQILEAGAVAARNDLGDPAVLQRMREVALANGFTLGVSNGAGDDRLALGSARNCFCPEDPDGVVDCQIVCSGQRPTIPRYWVTAAYSSALQLRLWRTWQAIDPTFILPVIPDQRLWKEIVLR